MICKEVIGRKAQKELPYRVLDDRVASENTHMLTVRGPGEPGHQEQFSPKPLKAASQTPAPS